jgi:hypothetical protein
LTLGDKPQPLCEEHFLRLCPDCEKWFGNDENPGFFRCLDCAAKTSDVLMQPEWSDAPTESYLETESYVEIKGARSLPHALGGRAGFDANMLAMSAAGCAFLVLLGWFLLGR